MSTADRPESVVSRLIEGFELVASVRRGETWSEAGALGLNPTQASILTLLAGRPGGTRAKDIAAQLSISQASLSDTIAALARKGMIERTPDPDDGRAAVVGLTGPGAAAAAQVQAATGQVGAALGELEPAEQARLLLLQIKTIRLLQLAGAIPIQRMCVSCRHFRPRAHPGSADPHHCAFVDAAFGDRSLRLDCREHEAADPAVQAATWEAFAKGPPNLQATAPS